MRTLLFLITALWANSIVAQWQGETGKFQIFTDSLQLNDSVAGNAYLSYPSDIVDSAQWDFAVSLGFNPSSINYAKVYLKSEKSDFQGNAYYVKIGGSDDEISLFRQDGSPTKNEKIIDGLDKRIDVSKVKVKIRVKYNDGLWELSSQQGNEAYQEEGRFVDSTYYLSSYFGVYANYTKTRAKLMSFSQFEWQGNAYQDTDAPRLDSMLVLTNNSIRFCYNEEIDSASFSYLDSPAIQLEKDSNNVVVHFQQEFPARDTFYIDYVVSDSTNNISKNTTKVYYTPFEVLFAQLTSPDSVTFKLNKSPIDIQASNISLGDASPTQIERKDDDYIAVFEHALAERILRPLTISGMHDKYGDELVTFSTEVSYLIPRFQDLLFTEIMSDPSPVIDTLPEVEYLEFFNNSAFTLAVEGWYLQREENNYYLPKADILPFSYVVICSEKSSTEFSTTTPIIALSSFPTLQNTEMELSLRSPQGTLIDYVYYHKNWHSDDYHANGGFSLERIDLQNPSMLDNWTSSCAAQGGTPGAVNCADDYNPDTIAPQFTLGYALDQHWLYLKLKEIIYKPQLTDLSYYTMSNALSIDSIVTMGEQEFVDKLKLHLAQAMTPYQVYEINIAGISDLSNNRMNDTSFQVAVCAEAEAGDILFTEIMFDPISEGVEYIELYNASQNPLDLSEYALAKPEESNSWSSPYTIAEDSYLFLPQHYLVLTSDKTLFSQQYPTISNVIEMSSFPSLNNSLGTWGILNRNAQPIDQMSYDVNDHSALLDDTKGVALERVSLQTSATIGSNWQSASSLQGYATPGQANSQQEEATDIQSVVELTPRNFTPDDDGIDDRLKININGSYAGSSVKVSIYNQRAIRVKQLLENDLIGSLPILYWDGTDDEMQRCPMGPYIIYIEIISTDHKVIYERQEVILSDQVR